MNLFVLKVESFVEIHSTVKWRYVELERDNELYFPEAIQRNVAMNFY